MPVRIQPPSESEAGERLPQTAIPPRIPELEALRGFGALAIVGCHLWPSSFYFGWTRADFFFVLSGYLITSTVWRHGSRPCFLYTFWARRALRIWPAYYLLMSVILLSTFRGGAPPGLVVVVEHLTFTQNLPYYWSDAAPAFPAAARQTWTLAIEEQFYLIWPLILHFVGRSRTLHAAAWLIVTSLVSRLCGLTPVVILARGDGLALGAVLAVLLNDGSWVRRRAAMLSLIFTLTGAVAAALLFFPHPMARSTPHDAFGSGSLSIFAAGLTYFSVIGLVVCHTGRLALSPLRNRFFGYLGRISYGIFLYHLLIIQTVLMSLGSRGAGPAAALLLSVLAGAASWELLERPIGDLKRRYKY